MQNTGTLDAVASPNMPYPWQHNQWSQFSLLVKQNKLPQALLLSGIEGVGKDHFAHCLANLCLCRADGVEQACGQCDGCQLTKAHHHPDLITLEPEGKSNTIKVDSIRALKEWAVQTPVYNGYKVVILNQAEQMNMAACNSLLKTLEEPEGKTVFILVSESPIQLPATVRSRCQIVKFAAPRSDDIVSWVQKRIPKDCDAAFMLHLAYHAPLRAVALADPEQLKLRTQFLSNMVSVLSKQSDPILIAKSWCQTDLRWLLQNLFALLMDLVKLNLDNHTQALYHCDFVQSFLKVLPSLRQSQLLALQDKVQSAYQSCVEKFNLNPQLLLEDLFIEMYQRLTKPVAIA